MGREGGGGAGGKRDLGRSANTWGAAGGRPFHEVEKRRMRGKGKRNSGKERNYC